MFHVITDAWTQGSGTFGTSFTSHRVRRCEFTMEGMLQWGASIHSGGLAAESATSERNLIRSSPRYRHTLSRDAPCRWPGTSSVLSYQIVLKTPNPGCSCAGTRIRAHFLPLSLPGQQCGKVAVDSSHCWLEEFSPFLSIIGLEGSFRMSPFSDAKAMVLLAALGPLPVGHVRGPCNTLAMSLVVCQPPPGWTHRQAMGVSMANSSVDCCQAAGLLKRCTASDTG